MGAAPFTVQSTPDFENNIGMEWNRTPSHDCSELFWLHQLEGAARTQHVTRLT